MTCACGAQMCYLCKLPLTGANANSYDHFYGQGVTPVPGKCSLHQDTKALHKKEVTAAAVKAKEELSLAEDLAGVLNIDVAEGKVVIE